MTNNLECVKKNFSNSLIHWYKKNKRDLPWRKTRDPYKIWLSEIILQQTRIATGLPYYKKFIRKYPNVIVLSQAREEDILKMWEGLGYYSRCENMYKTSQLVNSSLPNNYQDLIKLPGIGDYTAKTILSIAFEKPGDSSVGKIWIISSSMKTTV